MTTDIEVRKTKTQALVAQVRDPRFTEQVALALPEGTPPARFVRIAITALLENPELADAAPDSVWNALLRAAGDGLLPDGREAALTVDRGKAGPRARYMPMIGGFRKIAADHGWSIEARAVYAADTFGYELGEKTTIAHSPAPLGVERGAIVAAYAVGRHLASGRTIVEVMTAEDVAKARRKAKTQAVWNDWPERMTEKTVGRRLFKLLPLGTDRRAASVLNSDELEPGEAEELVYGPAPHRATDAADGTDPPPAAGGASEQVQESQAAATPAAPFTGEEPAAPEPRPVEELVAEGAANAGELEAAGGFVLGDAFTRFAGRTLAEVAELEPDYLAWLASDAVEDAELRAAAQTVLEATS